MTRLRTLALVVLAVAATAVPASSAAAAPGVPTLKTTPAEWENSLAAVFTFTAEKTEGFECKLDNAAGFTTCSPDGDGKDGRQEYTDEDLSEGPHTFAVRSIGDDPDEEPSEPRTYSWTIDLTPPSFGTMPDVVAEATSAAGATVGYTVPSATDNLDPGPTVECSPGSGSFPIGATDVTCKAKDLAGNEGVATFHVKVADTTAPIVSPHADVVVEQNAPGGANAVYETWPTALDAVDADPTVTCSPSAPVGSPHFFALADSPVAVSCGASDDAGNVRAPVELFHVIVNAGAAPPEPTITTYPPPVAKATAASFSFEAEGDVTTTCRLDGPSPSAETPCTSSVDYSDLEDGEYLFTVEARDNDIETISQATYGWQVDTTAPAAVGGLAGRGAAGAVTLGWQPTTDGDVEKIRVLRQRLGGSTWRFVALLDAAAVGVTDRSVTNGVRYRYRVETVDDAKNVSPPAFTTERPSRVFAPQYGAEVTRPPVVDWTSVSHASYYNVQVWRNGRKILSRWPLLSRLYLTQTWRYNGRAYRLGPGWYTVYVWPGFGSKASARYGRLLGTTSFRVPG